MPRNYAALKLGNFFVSIKARCAFTCFSNKCFACCYSRNGSCTEFTSEMWISILWCWQLHCDGSKKKTNGILTHGINLGHFRVTSLLLKQLLATWGSRYVSLDYFRPPFISCVSPGHNISVWWVDMRTDFWSSPLSIGFWTRFLIDSWHREICQTRWCNGWPRPSFGQILASAIAAMIKNRTSKHPKIFTGGCRGFKMLVNIDILLKPVHWVETFVCIPQWSWGLHPKRYCAQLCSSTLFLEQMSKCPVQNQYHGKMKHIFLLSSRKAFGDHWPGAQTGR